MRRPTLVVAAAPGASMYEMYPQAWAVADGTQPRGSAPRPRRRPRKEHSVVPALIARLQADELRRAPG